MEHQSSSLPVHIPLLFDKIHLWVWETFHSGFVKLNISSELFRGFLPVIRGKAGLLISLPLDNEVSETIRFHPPVIDLGFLISFSLLNKRFEALRFLWVLSSGSHVSSHIGFACLDKLSEAFGLESPGSEHHVLSWLESLIRSLCLNKNSEADRFLLPHLGLLMSHEVRFSLFDKGAESLRILSPGGHGHLPLWFHGIYKLGLLDSFLTMFLQVGHQPIPVLLVLLQSEGLFFPSRLLHLLHGLLEFHKRSLLHFWFETIHFLVCF